MPARRRSHGREDRRNCHFNRLPFFNECCYKREEQRSRTRYIFFREFQMAERLNKLLLYTYGVADLCFTLMVNMELYFFAAFLTDNAQFSLLIVAQILGVTASIDIVCALAGGAVLQKATLKHGGKYRSWFLIGPPIVAPLFVLQFTKIGSDFAAEIIIMIGFLASHLLFNVVFSANGAMLGRLSQLPDERTILSTSRAQGMAAAGLIFSATAMPMIMFFGKHTNKVTGFTITVAVYALLMVLGYWYIYAITAGKDPYDEITVDKANKNPGQSIAQIVVLAFRNPPLLLLILSQIFLNTSYVMFTAMATYYFTYVAARPAFLSVFILAISVARFLGAFLARWIGVRYGKRNAYWVFTLLAAAGYGSAKIVTESIWIYTLIFCISTLLAAVASSMSTALFADTVIYGEWKTGQSIRAFIMALLNFPIKVGILIRSAGLPIGLMAIGFVANAAPTPRVTEGIHSIMTLTPAAGYAIAAIIFYFGYKLDDSHVLKMQEEIAARKTVQV
jgi:Na+/melibiose symporter-like transporter